MGYLGHKHKQDFKPQRNIYVSQVYSAEATLIEKDVVTNRNYGYNNFELIINTLSITAWGSAAGVITLWLEHRTPATFDPAGDITISESENTSDDIEKYYILYETVIPVGASIKLDADTFKDIDFTYFDLKIQGNGDTRADVIINFKSK